MELAVPVLTEREKRLPLTYTCHKDNISPPLEWAGAPAGTKSFALMLVKDVEPPFTGWAIFNIPPDFTGLKENLPKRAELENGICHARSNHDASEYVGPCDPQGRFRYAFRLYALDVMLPLGVGAPVADLEAAMKGHVLDMAEAPFLHYLRF
ncbi:MAG: YbhB/YbcL family Raf kinase inhibitor-like protein [Proteobacteria bacterium]|nr:YbhB/YbcL family Raf kinase inhibitor-like protein [Pseudomonadota bacterium]